ncbi:MAG: TolC family protein, partial [Bacteroidota bacterium]|nr:TolC family protein [Bacteroidota bacterium]
MFKGKHLLCTVLLCAGLVLAGCHVPALVQVTENRAVPTTFDNHRDTVNMAMASWRNFFTDRYLVALIDTALKNNQELLITLQEVEMARNDIRFRQGPLQPTIGARLGIGVDKVGRYTSQGAGDASTKIDNDREIPDPLPDFTAALYATWELDIWKKLRNAKKAAITRYLATVEGKNFVLTNLVGEVASLYYELLALDNQLEIVQQNIALQKSAFEVVKLQKEATRVTELAVQKFAAEVLKSQSLEYDILQQIKATENKLNFLLGRFPQPVPRDRES